MASSKRDLACRDEHRADLVPVLLRLLTAQVGSEGHGVAGLLRGSGFGPEDLLTPGFNISYRQCVDVLRRAGAGGRLALEDGVRLGARLNVVSLGKLGLGMMASADTGDMFRLLTAFHRVGGFPLALQEVRTGGHVDVEVQPSLSDPDIQPFLVGYTVSALLGLARQVAGPGFRVRGVWLALPRPADVRWMERALDCRVDFEAGSHCLSLAPAPLPIATADRCVAQRMRELLAQISPREPLLDHGAAVAQVIRRHGAAVPTLAQIAQALNMTERTLRRKLADQGLSYRSLLAEERRLRTLALVRGTHAAMHDVAEQTGYGSPRSLRRAVQRWTGHGPSAERRVAASHGMAAGFA
ncbi:AraC family transcriptional regulator [Pseudacidovorax intermedius]|uniref:AraC family transcriptional regulator n=1 Tax=Pseudacidovorax intermedius TaxID=433924 RepID=UPI000733D8C9|nr:AraC family transcriptional regulator [Pseudacidovorax intermedius]